MESQTPRGTRTHRTASAESNTQDDLSPPRSSLERSCLERGLTRESASYREHQQPGVLARVTPPHTPVETNPPTHLHTESVTRGREARVDFRCPGTDLRWEAFKADFEERVILCSQQLGGVTGRPLRKRPLVTEKIRLFGK